jgi:hypothetical protein
MHKDALVQLTLFGMSERPVCLADRRVGARITLICASRPARVRQWDLRQISGDVRRAGKPFSYAS